MHYKSKRIDETVGRVRIEWLLITFFVTEKGVPRNSNNSNKLNYKNFL
jgi:hypothetical protein